jgi:hypothetical protein
MPFQSTNGYMVNGLKICVNHSFSFKTKAINRNQYQGSDYMKHVLCEKKSIQRV